MPCYDDRRDDDARLLQDATRAGCEMAKLVLAKGLFDSLSLETRQWIRVHQRQDALHEVK